VGFFKIIKKLSSLVFIPQSGTSLRLCACTNCGQLPEGFSVRPAGSRISQNGQGILMQMWGGGRFWVARCAAALALVFVVMSGFAVAGSQPHYVVTNDDALFGNSVSFYSIGTGGLITLDEPMFTGGSGIAGGYFGENRIAMLDSGGQECIYVSDASTGDIDGIDVTTLEAAAVTFGSATDTGLSNGIGLAMNGKYLYASFTDSNTIGTFTVEPGCTLTFVNDISVAGLQGGVINGMALHGNILVATYGDGSIQSFNVSAGTPVSNGDEQNSTAFTKSQGATYPNSVEITKDGHFAIFGDTSSSTVVEVSNIASGKLSRTTIYSQKAPINSSNILLSPDETLLYVSNTEGDAITALFFDAATGKVSPGCTSGKLKGYSRDWSYLGSLALETNSGTGGVVYAAEFGSPSYIAMIQVSSAAGKCTLKESSKSPVTDSNSPGLLSIGSFPPRSF
jgi:sugar lactone lactonase YvrE